MENIVLKLRGGTTAQHATFTGQEREVTLDTTKNTLVVHDGATPGGVPLAKASDIQALNTALDGKLDSESITTLTLSGDTLTYTDENGTPTNISLSKYNNAAGTIAEFEAALV